MYAACCRSRRHPGIVGRIDPVEISIAIIDPVTVIPPQQNVRKLVHLSLIFPVKLGVTALRTISAAQFQLDLIKPG